MKSYKSWSLDKSMYKWGVKTALKIEIGYDRARKYFPGLCRKLVIIIGVCKKKQEGTVK